MSEKQRFWSKILWISLSAIITAILCPLIVAALTKHIWPDKSPEPPPSAPNLTALPTADRTNSQTKTPARSVTSTPMVVKKGVPQSVVMDYDALQPRFVAVEADLKSGFENGAGAQGIKASILSDIETCRTDLAAAKNGIKDGNTEAVQQRLERARQALSRLEALRR